MYLVFSMTSLLDLQNLTSVKATWKTTRSFPLSISIYGTGKPNTRFDGETSNRWDKPLDIASSQFIVMELSWWPILKDSSPWGYIQTISHLAPMNILEEFTNFLSLALQVFGNIFAEVMASLLITLSHQALYWYPVAFGANLGLDSLFCLYFLHIQAYVYTMLKRVTDARSCGWINW